MKVSLNFFLTAIMTTILSIIFVSIFCANEEYYKLIKEVQDVEVTLRNSDFRKEDIVELRKRYPHISLIQESAYMYRIKTTYRYDIPLILFHDERDVNKVLYQGGW